MLHSESESPIFTLFASKAKNIMFRPPKADMAFGISAKPIYRPITDISADTYIVYISVYKSVYC